MNVIVTGSAGFIAKNLVLRLSTEQDITSLPISRATSSQELDAELDRADFIVHLAGSNRPTDDSEFRTVNDELTADICRRAAKTGRTTPILLASSLHAERDTPYGNSKKAAENHVVRYAEETGAKVFVYRLPNVFGKWCRPNYNSVVATFCHNIAHGLPIAVHDPAAPLRLVYVDDVVEEVLAVLRGGRPEGMREVAPEYATSVGEVAAAISSFRADRRTLMVDRVGRGLTRALYATYLSYLEPADFSYTLPRHADARGVFVEMLKTIDSGQFSFFTAAPGIIRGAHFHHTKNEKFLVVTGEALFRFRQMDTGAYHEVSVSGAESRVVETVPGWAHDITNIGSRELVVLLWANEAFDRSRPDTFSRDPRVE